MTTPNEPSQTQPKAVHFILQGKGGVGKSLVAAIAQYVRTRTDAVVCFDTDPINQTLTNYRPASPATHKDSWSR